jgi:hypothetical protein
MIAVILLVGLLTEPHRTPLSRVVERINPSLWRSVHSDRDLVGRSRLATKAKHSRVIMTEYPRTGLYCIGRHKRNALPERRGISKTF